VRLRTRITVTFALLVAAILAATLGVVSSANSRNAAREVQRRLETGALVLERTLESNRRQLTQAAQVLAADFGFRSAVATRDTATLESALTNHAERIGARLVMLLSLDGEVLAEGGTAHLADLESNPDPARRRGAAAALDGIVARNGRVFQLVSVTIRSPVPVARVLMGFEIDRPVLTELGDILGMGVALAVRRESAWRLAGTTLPETTTSTLLPALAASRESSFFANDGERAVRAIVLAPGDASRQPAELADGGVVALLSSSVEEARAAFDELTEVLWYAAALALLVAALASFTLARGITGPLVRLTQAVDRIARGEYRVDVDVKRGDEVGVLAAGLQQMRDEVEVRDASIRRLAYEDGLTGLANRNAFMAALDARLGSAPVPPTCVALIDLRRFRAINECLGYAVGDEVLRAVAQRLARPRGDVSLVAHLAADQFAAFGDLPGDGSPTTWGQRLLDDIAHPVALGGQSIDVTPVVGVAVAPHDALTGTELLRCADLACDQAKRRNLGLAGFGPQIPRPGREKLSLLGDLQRAIAQDEFRLVLQPKVDFRTREITGAEVLLRWEHPHKGLLGPGAFMPFAEQSGFIRHISAWVLRRSIELAAGWARDGRPLPVSVNISAVDLANPLLDQLVADCLSASALPPGLLTLEVTESGFIERPEEALAMLQCLAALGTKLSIDDFGTGYSSLRYLATMPVDEIKIDKSFVDALETDEAVRAVISAAVDMGHRLGLSVVVEGIERPAQHAALRELGCDVAQGYLIGRPMAPAQFFEWLAAPHPLHAGRIATTQHAAGIARASHAGEIRELGEFRARAPRGRRAR
jgi:diguanylate cyclase